MAFPQVLNGQADAQATNSTSHVVSLPSTVNAGDRLILLFVCNGGGTYTGPGGTWSVLVPRVVNGTTHGIAAWEKIADGSEGGTTVTIGKAESVRSMAYVYRIGGAHASTASEAATPVGSSTTQTPAVPALNPSWGAEDTLFIAFGGFDMSAQAALSVTVAPSNYGNLVSQQSNAATSGVLLGAARRELNASGDDPDNFTLSASENPLVTLIAVRPADEGEEFTGTSAVTNAAPTSAASGSLRFTGTSAVTGAAAAVAASGSLAFTGTIAVTSAAPTVAASGPIPLSGEAAVTSAAPTVAVEATLRFTGTSSATGAAPTVAASGDETFSGTSAVTAPVATVSLSGTLGYSGTAAVTLPVGSTSAEGALAFAASAAVMSVAPSLVASGSIVAQVAGTATVSDTVAGVAVTIDEITYEAIVSDSSPYQAIVSDEAA